MVDFAQEREVLAGNNMAMANIYLERLTLANTSPSVIKKQAEQAIDFYFYMIDRYRYVLIRDSVYFDKLNVV